MIYIILCTTLNHMFTALLTLPFLGVSSSGSPWRARPPRTIGREGSTGLEGQQGTAGRPWGSWREGCNWTHWTAGTRRAQGIKSESR